jgi:hypothetical protein
LNRNFGNRLGLGAIVQEGKDLVVKLVELIEKVILTEVDFFQKSDLALGVYRITHVWP